jgi:antitoxin HicB
MSTSREYEVVLTPEAEGGFSVAVPALPGCASQGETREEALSMIREAIEAYIESLVAHGDPIPGPSARALRLEARSGQGEPPRLPASDHAHRVVVPMHGRDLAKGTLNQIVSVSGLDRAEFLKLL